MCTINANGLGHCSDGQPADDSRSCQDGGTASQPLFRVLVSFAVAVMLVAAPMAAQSVQAAAAVLPPVVDPDNRAAPPAATVVPPVAAPDNRTAPPADADRRLEQQATRGGAGYRSPGGSFSGGGAGTGATPGGGYRTGPRTPSPGVTTPPRATTPGAGTGLGRAGSFFGGMAAGALLGHLFNPFAGLGWGWGAGTGLGAGLGIVMSVVSILIWAGLLYGAYRLIRRMMRGGRGHGGGGWAR